MFQTSNQWRVRESCCNALSDLLRGRTLDDDKAIDFVPALWNDIFRVSWREKQFFYHDRLNFDNTYYM